MKKLLYLSVILMIFFACSSKKENPVEKAAAIENANERIEYLQKTITKNLKTTIFDELAYMLAKDYIKLERWEQLQNLGLTLLGRDAVSETVLNYIASSLIDQGVYLDIALELAKKAIDITENYDSDAVPDEYSKAAYHQRMMWKLSGYMDTYGRALLRLERYDEAESAFEDAIQLEPENIDALIHLAQTQMIAGKPESAFSNAAQASLYGGSAVADSLAKSAFEELKKDEKLFELVFDKTVDDLRREHFQTEIENQLNVPAPDFTLKDLDGNDVSLEDFLGQIVFIDFWAAWCPPCKKELPILQETFDNYSSEGVVFLAISTDKDTSKVKPFINENNYKFTVLFDNGMKKAYDVAGIPTVFIVDQEGIIRYEHVGYRPDVGELWAKQIKHLQK